MSKSLFLAATVLAASPVVAAPQDSNSVEQEIQALKERLAELEKRLEEKEKREKKEIVIVEKREVKKDKMSTPETNQRRVVSDSGVQARLAKLEEKTEQNENWPIKVHGAVRFQYEYNNYDTDNQNRTGDLDFDIFRLNFDGEMGDVILSAEYRWFNYQDVIKHAWFGYDFTDKLQGQVGVVKIPFGNMPYNSHSYFFDTTFYVGLEDEHDNGIRLKYRDKDWDFDVAFLKSDEQGGIDGATSDRTERYNYDTVGIRLPGQGAYDTPGLPVGESNSYALRAARKFHFSDTENLEIGTSVQGGNLYSGTAADGFSAAQAYENQNVGNRFAWAAHGVYNNGPWNVQLQYSDYEYDIKLENRGVYMAAYAYYDAIPAEAKLYTANVAYTLPVDIGPITSLTFYNDHSLMTDKRGYQDDTWMNVLGVAVAAGGGFYTYVDYVKAKNQPFIGGNTATDGGEVNDRFNINFGYYF
ncbi:carbohydrate porin [Idiomarina sp. HP20-50]|uniref:carbohydrate porin n=1 Tax=Idiomarina sp. HP20-50 TaxID=3070813 RepID=UPI00294AC06D|nr:carbohydrate porin [Idiomarina sp. HP20-50]MDV6315880.1 carbohydrate porin [Idiomarina sp. HP20-50]